MNTINYNGFPTPNSSQKSWGWVLYPLLAVVIFFATQIACSSVVATAFVLTGKIDFPMIMATGLLGSAIITTIILMLVKPFGLSNAFSRVGCKAGYAILAVVGVMLGSFAANVMTESLSLENTLEEEFLGMSRSWVGILAIGVAGPVCEEVVFRGGIMRPILNKGVNPWVAILCSAVVFGIIHWNPIQIPFAMVVGLMYGIVYYCTGSLVLTSICHILNNLSSVLAMNQFGKESLEVTTQQEVGTTWTIVLLVLAIVGCVVSLRVIWKRLVPERLAEQVSQTPSATSTF